jgi:hypothetical protein
LSNKKTYRKKIVTGKFKAPLGSWRKSGKPPEGCKIIVGLRSRDLELSIADGSPSHGGGE